MTYLERVVHDPALRAFIESEIARAGIDASTARLELEHKNLVIVSLQQRVAQLEAEAARATTKGKT